MQASTTKKTSRNYCRTIKYALLFFALAAFTAAFLSDPERYTERCAEGIILWATAVLPSLFPFMVVCGILTGTGLAAKISSPFARVTRVVKLPPCAAVCFVMGATAGYPSGSRTVYEFCSAGYINTDGAKKLAGMCSACGPLFAISTVGAGMYGNAAAGFKLYGAHIAAVLILSVIFSLCGKRTGGYKPNVSLKGGALYESFYGAVSAALTAGAYIAFFYTAALMARDFYILYPLERLLCLFTDSQTAASFCDGLVEMTGGCAALAKAGGELALPLTGFLITFGGGCILCQQAGYLLKSGVKITAFTAQKFAQGILCFLILLLLQ